MLKFSRPVQLIATELNVLLGIYDYYVQSSIMFLVDIDLRLVPTAPVSWS